MKSPLHIQKEIFQSLVENKAFWKQLWGFAKRSNIKLDDQEIEDEISEVLIGLAKRLFTKQVELIGDPQEAIKRYIYKSLKNNLNRSASKKIVFTSNEVIPEETEDCRLKSHPKNQLLYSSLEILPKLQKEVIYCKYWLGLSNSQIAIRMCKKVNAVNSLLKEAKKSLRQYHKCVSAFRYYHKLKAEIDFQELSNRLGISSSKKAKIFYKSWIKSIS